MPWAEHEEIDIKELVGYAFNLIEVNKDSTAVTFYGMAGQPLFKMTHKQDCCESVWLEEVVGDWGDLIGTPIFVAECVSNHNDPRANLTTDDEAYWDAVTSETWTFYKLTTMKGSVTLRWYGTSNGYYSEGVSIIPWVDKEEKD